MALSGARSSPLDGSAGVIHGAATASTPSRNEVPDVIQPDRSSDAPESGQVNPASLVFGALAWLLARCYDLVPDYGLAIALMTIAVMLVLTPLTWKSTRSMLEMQRLQPEIKKIQQRHKDDRQKMNEEVMAFYKEHNLNPIGGCLPMFLQFPVFIVMYRVIRGLTHTVIAGALMTGGTGSSPTLANPTYHGGHINGSSIVAGKPALATAHDVRVSVADHVVGTIKQAAIKDGRIAKATVVTGGGANGTTRTVGTVREITVSGGRVQGEPSYLDHASKLYKNLHRSNGRMHAFGLDLARSASTILHQGFLTVLPFFVLIALVIVTQYIQTKQMSGRAGPAAQTPQTQMMQRITPVMFGYFSYVVPAGLNVYFLTSALLRIGQQELMYRYDPVLVEHVRQQAKELEAKAYEKPKSFTPKPTPKSAKTTRNGRTSRNGSAAKAKGGGRSGNRRSKRGR